MLEKSPYPLLSLKLLGTLCPCLEKEEDGPARQAAWALGGLSVRWHRRLRGSSSDDDGGGSAAGKVTGFISGMFGSSAGGGGGGGGGGGDRYDAVDGASLSVVDAASGPRLVVSPPVMSLSRKKKVVPLRLIKKVRPRSGMFGTGARSGIAIFDNTDREVLRIDVLEGSASARRFQSPSGDTEDEDWDDAEGGGAVEDADESTRDEVIDQLEVLVEWERRRRAYIVTLGEDDDAENGEDEYVDEYDDEDTEGTRDTAEKRGVGAKAKGAIAEKGQCK